MSKFWSEFVHDLDPYVPGEQPRTSGLIKLNTNESPYPPSPQIATALDLQQIQALRLYPDPNSVRLKQAIADYYQLQSNQVFVGNGSDEVLALAFMAFFKRSGRLLFPDITYSFYPVYCKLFDIEAQTIPLDENFVIRLEEYPKENAGVIFPNPNAPTGIGKPLASIEAFLAENTDSVVVVDEAYIDFGGETAARLVERYSNLLVIQTFSKSRALAGARVGFALGSTELIAGLDRVKNSFNSYPIDRLAELAAITAMQDETYFQQCREKIIATRNWTSAKLAAAGFTVLPSQANFVMAKPHWIEAETLFLKLRENKILVRYFKADRINEYLRITIGTQEEMERLIKAVEQLKI